MALAFCISRPALSPLPASSPGASSRPQLRGVRIAATAPRATRAALIVAIWSSRGRLNAVGRRATVSTVRRREEKRELRRRFLEGQNQPVEVPKEEEPPEVPSGVAPVFASASETASSERDSKKKEEEPLDWNNPGLNVLEKARRAAEDWDDWDEHAPDAAVENGSDFIRVPKFFKRRLREAEAPESIKDFIKLHQLGNRVLPRLKRGEHYPAPFSGSDPAHDGRRGAVDDGKTDTLGRMAVAVHKGFMRQRAQCHPNPVTKAYPLPERPEVAFIGASNVGKSSLLNALTRTQKLAPAKDDPGVTRSIDWYKPSRLPVDVIDLPGYGYAKGSQFGPLVSKFIQTRKSLRLLYCLVDARTGVRPSDWDFYSSLGEGGPEKIFILTKCDMVGPKMLAKVAKLVLEDIKSVPRSSQRLIIASSRMGQGMHDLRCHICARAVQMVQEVKRRQEQLEKTS